MERDRRGGLRVFQGPALARPGTQPAPMAEPEVVEAAADAGVQDVEGVEVVVAPEPVDEPDVIEVQPMAVVDTTAELLGRATAKPRRTRTSSSTVAVAAAAPRAARATPRKTGTRKAAGSSRRGKKSDNDAR
jgi:hypothetical protein